MTDKLKSAASQYKWIAGIVLSVLWYAWNTVTISGGGEPMLGEGPAGLAWDQILPVITGLGALIFEARSALKGSVLPSVNAATAKEHLRGLADIYFEARDFKRLDILKTLTEPNAEPEAAK